ncbi:MAG: type II toxin-antitoxin system VapB family antitoxin, partial [Burkholderiales bacterium]
ARKLAAQTGESLTRAIETALSERLERVRRRGRSVEALRELQAYVSSLPVLDQRGDDEILGYDQDGRWR